MWFQDNERKEEGGEDYYHVQHLILINGHMEVNERVNKTLEIGGELRKHRAM